MKLFKTAGKLILLAAAACVGAAAGDVVYQRVTGEQGRVMRRSKGGEWTINVPPQVLIPAIVAGFRAKEKGVLRAAGTAAMIAGTGGKGMGGIAQRFFGKKAE